MTPQKMNNVIESLVSSFEKRMTGKASDIRESVALVDLYLRIIYLLIVAESRSNVNDKLKVIGMPGFGTMYGLVKMATTKTDVHDSNPWQAKIRSCAHTAVHEIDKFKVPGRYKSFISLRNRLSHGHSIPADDAVAQDILNELQAIINKVKSKLQHEFTDSRLEERKKKLHLVTDDSKDTIDVTHLWAALPDDSGMSIYSHFSTDAIYYIAPNGDLHVESEPIDISKFSKELLADYKKNGQELGRLVKDTLRDVSSFTEDYSTPGFYFGDAEETGNLYIPWTRSTSDDNQSRIDVFRVGPDNRKEWRKTKEDDWVAYSEFIKDIANWPILARRIGIGLDNFNRDRIEEEVSRLGIAQRTETRGPAHLKEVDDDLQRAENNNTFQLGPRVDDACQKMKPSTAVFFIVGQAGLGKTDLMLSLARERALEIAEDPSKKEPLYLFVSSTGRTLASLEDAVNGALNITKLLSSHGARALCRNGMLVLLVDGFDELLGSSGYHNALGSLEPWFKELGGRGVLVASARSSYYLTQYRRSLAEMRDINVDHTLIELQSWSRNETERYLLDSGMPPGALKKLEDRDWDILSIPFFSKAFSAWFEKHERKNDAIPSIFDIVVEQYLGRESLKLKDPHQGVLLSPAELENLFSEIAEMMQMGKVREIDLSELIMCAQQIVGEPLDYHRPGLSMRLPSLCGLGVNADTKKPAQFSFSHDIMFDCFLSLALQRNIESGVKDSYFVRIMDKSKVNTSVFEWVLQKNSLAIDELSTGLNFSVDISRNNDVISENLGSLWCTILKNNAGVPPTNTIKGLQLGIVSLADTGWTSLTIENCKIEHLSIPRNGNFSIALKNTEIDYLSCKDNKQLRKVVGSLDSSKINSIHISGVYADTPMQIRNILSDLELIRPEEGQSNSYLSDAAKYYLDRMKTRPDVPIVVTRDDKIADDERLSWTHRLEDSVWIEFLNKLIQFDLAKLEVISTSGKPKSRLVFNMTPTEILRQDGGSANILNFWIDLSGAHS